MSMSICERITLFLSVMCVSKIPIIIICQNRNDRKVMIGEKWV